MTLLQTANIDMEIRRFKKELDRNGLRRELEIRSYPKPSERKKQKTLKARLARMKGRKREKMIEGKESRNEQAPSWRFVLRDGEYVKVPVAHKEMRQQI